MQDPSITRRRLLETGAFLAASLAVGGCGSSSSRSGSTTLRVGNPDPPLSLDPTKSGEKLFADLTYDPLLYRAPDGNLEPRLATSWRYIGTGNTTFELKLRPNVTFSDGAPLTAAAVKENIQHYREAGTVPQLAPVKEIEVLDDLTLRVTTSEPHPYLPETFSQDYTAGRMISPKAIADPERLASRSFGAGPYVLAPRDTVANDHYSYVPNEEYWNKDGIHFERFSVKVLRNENTALSALKTGQIDALYGNYGIANGAKAAGMGVTYSPNIVIGIQLNDREGELSAPLADQRVRQALNYAVDREKITKAILGEYGTPTDQPAAPGRDGYNDTTFYPYDLDKARSLLGEAGYADGFKLPVVMTPSGTTNALVEAIAAALEDVGVAVEIELKEPSQFFSSLSKYPASVMGWGALPMYFMGRGLWLRDATGINPFKSSDPVLERLDRAAAAADEERRAELDQEICRRVVELAWFLPVSLSPIFLFHRKTIEIDSKEGEYLPTVDSWRPAA